MHSAPDLPDWLALTDNGSGTATLTGTASEYEVWQYYWKDPDNYWANPQQSIDITVSDGVNSKVVSHDFSIINVLNEPIPTPLYWPPLDNIYDLFMQGSAWLFPEGVSRTIDWALTDVIDSWGASSDFVASKINEIVEATEKFIDIDFNYAGYFTSYPEANKAGVELNFSLDYGHIINSSGSYGIAGFPSLETISASSDDWFFDYFQAGDVYLNTNMFSGLESASADVVTDFQFVALHEMGHALGLKHPHDTGGTQRPTFDDAGMDEYNDVLYTIMAYENTGVFATNSIAVPLTPMILDAITLQYLYGKKTTGDSVGDTLYEPGVDYGAYVLDYDVSGYDTFSAAKLNVAQEIYINQFIIADTCVSFLNDSGDVPPLQQAVGVLGSIENVVCTSNDDLIFDYSNNDLMTTKITSLSLDGGSGEDNLTLIKSFSDIELLSLSNATYTMQFSDITYQLKNVESLTDAASETKSIEQLYNEYKINEAPVLATAIVDATATEDSAYIYDASANFSDVDGDALTYTATLSNGDLLPSWLAISSTGTLSGTPSNGDVGAIEVTVTATDSSSASTNDTFALTVSNTNDTNSSNSDNVSDAIINTYTESNQNTSNVTSLIDGGYIVSWQSYGQDGSGGGVYFQRYDSAGVASGTEQNISSVVEYEQNGPMAVSLGNGNIAVAWHSNSQGISANDMYAKIYDANGTLLVTDFLVNTTTDKRQDWGDIAAFSNGGFVVTWHSSAINDLGFFENHAQMFHPDGSKLGEEIKLNTFEGGLYGIGGIATLANNDFIVTWSSHGQDGSQDGVFAQRFDAAGDKVGIEFQVNTYTSDSQRQSSVAAMDDGGFVITWESMSQDGSGFGVYAKRYNSDGTAQSATDQIINTNTSQGQFAPEIAVLTDGSYVIAWFSKHDGDTYVYAKRLGETGNDMEAEFKVSNDIVTYEYGRLSISSLEDGGYIITWSSDDSNGLGVYAKRYDKFDNAMQSMKLPTVNSIVVEGPSELITGTTLADTITSLGGTNSIAAKEGNDSITLTADSTWSSGYVAKNISSGDSIGTHQALELTGLNRFSDVIDGGADVDTLTLTSGSDAFFLDDVYSGHHESLTLSETTRGTDSTARIINLEVINAGAGNDIIDLTSLDFTLADSVTINGEAGNDTLWSSNANDILNGGAGNDTLFGGSGDDTLTGGTGQDTFQFTATSGSDTISDFTVSDQDILEFYYRSGNTSDINDLTLTNGVLNWDTGDDDRTVQIDLSGTITSGDINDYSDLISFVEIA